MRFQVPMPRPEAVVRLFCFPHAGGAAASYVGWARALESQSIELAAAQLPGRDGPADEPPCMNLDLLVDMFADAIASTIDRPYAFFGHSLGALVAFELGRRPRDWHAVAAVHPFV